MTVANILPAYLDFRGMRFEDKSVLENAFRVYEPKISEYTFTNLFAWRESHQVLLSQIGETILIKRWNPELKEFFLLPPIGSNGIVDVVDQMLLIADEDFFPFYGLNRMQAESLEKEEGFKVKEIRDSWDYVYSSKNLINLPGEKYYVKRKNIEKYMTEYKLEYRPLTEESIEKCLRLQTNWCDLRNCTAIPGLESEHKATKEALFHFSDLNIFGGIVLVKGNVEAFTIGERLNSNTAVIHFEKANPNIAGLYQVINQQFCYNALQGFEYVNREQDL